MNGEQIMTLVFLALLSAFVAFYRYSRTDSWERSETRAALLNVIVAVGPLLGMHYKPPRPPLPGIMTPGPKRDAAAEPDLDGAAEPDGVGEPETGREPAAAGPEGAVEPDGAADAEPAGGPAPGPQDGLSRPRAIPGADLKRDPGDGPR